jgi:formate--tetrahydrofolate ligase
LGQVPSDIEIAQNARLRPIVDVAKELGLDADDLDLYGKYKAKIGLDIAERPARGKLVLVTGINPTAAGEGKTTTAVGVTQALRKIGQNATLCIREPSLGPVARPAGSRSGWWIRAGHPDGRHQSSLHGDFHAISVPTAPAAMLDNHLHQGNALGIDSPDHLAADHERSGSAMGSGWAVLPTA